ncbi:MAG: PDZ domain-containing protein [Chloroflexi bacterium]|nr:PDZ domain-containing protein [Chloroflexota bacterium]
MVYTTPTCPYCHQVKAFLVQRGVKFQERDVSVDKTAAAEMIEKTGQRGVPVTLVDGQVVVGFDRPRLEHLLGRQGTGRRPSLGIQVADAGRFAQRRGDTPVPGALVGGVTPGSVGDKLGLKRGDIITEMDLQTVQSVEDIERTMAGMSPGDRVTVAFRRGPNVLKNDALL